MIFARRVPFANYQEAGEAYKRLLSEAQKQGPQAVMATMAALGRADLFFLLSRFMRRPDTINDWCFDRCKEVAENPNGYIDLWAREHYKSTIITVALSIQDILNDPEETIGLLSHTVTNAGKFLGQIKREFEINEPMKRCYPEVLYQNPEKESPSWSIENGLLVKRQTNPKEVTVEAGGVVKGQQIGKHYRKMVYDDIVTPDSVGTAEQIKKTTEMLRVSFNLGARGGHRRIIGTRYHMFDTYAELLKDGVAIPRIYAATVDGKADGQPRFLSPELLAQKRKEMGPYVFACQMLLNPVAEDAQGFKDAWLHLWNGAEEHWRAMNRVILVDPASSKKKDSDYTVFAVVGWNVDQHLYLIHGIRARFNLTERTKTLFRLVRQYQPLFTAYERYGMQSDIEHIQGEMDRENFHFNIQEIGGQTAKPDRIRRLIPWFENGRFHLPAQSTFKDHEGKFHNFTTLFIEEEFTSFPVCAHDDMLDCLARAVDPQLNVPWPDAVDGRSAVEKELERMEEARRAMNDGPGAAMGVMYGYDQQQGAQW